MKLRIVAVAVVLILLLSIAGCAKEPLPTGAGGNGTEDGWIWAWTSYGGALSDSGYYHLKDSSFLYYTEISSGTAICLCSKAGCLHDKETDVFKIPECDAYIENTGIMPMFFWNKRLYYIDQDLYGMHIYSRNETGTDLKEHTSIGAQFTGEKKSVELFAFTLVDGYLYYEATVDGIVYDEVTQQNKVIRELFYIGRVDLAEGKDSIILKDTNALYLCAASKSGVLAYSYDSEGIDYDQPNYREEQNKRMSTLMRWYAQTGATEVLLEKTKRDFDSVMTVSGNRVFCRDKTGNNWYYDLETGVIGTIVQGNVSYLGARYALVKDETVWKLLDPITGQELQNELMKDRLTSGARSDSGFVLIRSVKGNDGAISEKRYYYVAYTAMIDGLQEKDLKLLYIQQAQKPPTSLDDLRG